MIQLIFSYYLVKYHQIICCPRPQRVATEGANDIYSQKRNPEHNPGVTENPVLYLIGSLDEIHRLRIGGSDWFRGWLIFSISLFTFTVFPREFLYIKINFKNGSNWRSFQFNLWVKYGVMYAPEEPSNGAYGYLNNQNRYDV